jgi:hypothetical protein
MVSRRYPAVMRLPGLSAAELAQQYAEILDLRKQVKKAELNRKKRSTARRRQQSRAGDARMTSTTFFGK